MINKNSNNVMKNGAYPKYNYNYLITSSYAQLILQITHNFTPGRLRAQLAMGMEGAFKILFPLSFFPGLIAFKHSYSNQTSKI